MSLSRVLFEGYTTCEIRGFKIVGIERASMFEPKGRGPLSKWVPTEETIDPKDGKPIRGSIERYTLFREVEADLNKTPGLFVFINKDEAVKYLYNNYSPSRTIIDVQILTDTRYRVGMSDSGGIVYLVAKLKVIS